MRKVLISLLMMGMFCMYERGNASDKILNRIPKYGHLQLDLRENIVIMEIESDPNYSFGRALGDLAVDQDGNLFILDFDRILKYDSLGKIIGPIGKKGSGPAEFAPPDKIFIHERGDIYISDRARILHVYKNDGKYVKQIMLSFMISPGTKELFIDRDENIYAAMLEMSESGPSTVLVKADPNGKILKRIEAAPDSNTQFKGSRGRGIMGGVIHAYSERFCFSPAKNAFLCCGTNTKYDLFLYDLDGNLKVAFSKEEEAIAISAEEKKKLGPDAVFPPHRPFIANILSDEEGRIYILKAKSNLDKSPMIDIDIFSLNGHYLYRTEVPFKPRVIANGAFYSIEQDENQLRTIKKWVIHNYREMKTD